MSENRVLLIENPAYLSVDLGRIRIRRDGFNDVFVLPGDISVLVVHHPVVSFTAAVLQALTAGGAMLLVNDERHLPTAMLWPWKGQDRMAGRLRQQMKLDQNPQQKNALWAEIVRSRLNTQASNLRYFNLRGALRLERMVPSVEPGDPKNLEAQGARHYWKYLLPEGVRRTKKGAKDPVNARLNYGYAVLRAMVARALASHGLQPALGLGHISAENPFNLADDFVEPFRFCVERQIVGADSESEFDGDARVRVLGFIEAEVPIHDQIYRLPAAIAETVNGFLRILSGKKKALALPGI